MKLIPVKVVGTFFLLTAAFIIGFAIQDYFHDRGEKQKLEKMAQQARLNGQPADLNQDPYVLDFTGQDLVTLPDFIFERPPITHMILTNNNLQSLPEDMQRLSSLRELDVRDNELTNLPDTINQTELIDLNASNNQLNSIPNAIGDMQTLRYLDVSHNQITSLPESITNLQDLKWLNLAGNPLNQSEVNALRSQMISTIINF